jgi:hypothetical protein
MLRLHANIRPWVQLTRAYVCARLVENAHPTRSKDARLRRSGAKRTPWLSVDAFHGTSYRALEGTFSAAASSLASRRALAAGTRQACR